MSQQLTRQALFDMIWQTPMKRLAIEWGITPQALSKLCDSFEIPKPGYGYWTLREMGRPVEIPALGVNRLSDEIITIEAPMRRVSRSRVSATPKSSIPELTPKLELKDVDGVQEPDGSTKATDVTVPQVDHLDFGSIEPDWDEEPDWRD